MSNRNDILKKQMEDRMSDLEVEIQELESAYNNNFPEPSEQLNSMNILSDEYWELYRKIEKIEDESE